MVKTQSDRAENIDAFVEKFQKELVEKVMAGFDWSVEKVMAGFNWSPVKNSNCLLKEKPSCSKSSAVGHRNAESKKCTKSGSLSFHFSYDYCSFCALVDSRGF